MTEAQWLACDDPDAMVQSPLFPRADRALCLFGCACCRRVWHLMPDERSRAVVELRERQADGSVVSDGEELAALAAAKEALHEIARNVRRGLRSPAEPGPGSRPARGATEAPVFAADAAYLTAPVGLFTSHSVAEAIRRLGHANGAAAYARERAAHCDLLREIVGPLPFRPVPFSPSWRTDTAVTLARQMYDARDFSAVPILADALEDAGCDSDDVLSHCRDVNQVHVRGCWVVDLVLGRE